MSMDEFIVGGAAGALFKHHKKLYKKNTSKSTKNKKPENLAMADVMLTLKREGWFLFRFEAKSAYDPKSGKYRMTHVFPGHPDVAGICPHGFPAYIEVKAKGRRYALRDNQREFLIQVIEKGGFGVVTDSSDFVLKTYNEWIKLSKQFGRIKSHSFLLDKMPKKKDVRAF